MLEVCAVRTFVDGMDHEGFWEGREVDCLWAGFGKSKWELAWNWEGKMHSLEGHMKQCICVNNHKSVDADWGEKACGGVKGEDWAVGAWAWRASCVSKGLWTVMWKWQRYTKGILSREEKWYSHFRNIIRAIIRKRTWKQARLREKHLIMMVLQYPEEKRWGF